MSEPPYRGRFAPSPTGPLHLGSLFTALASYLDARAHGGVWLLRIEDIDPPREQRGATESIIASLRAHGFAWDGEPLFQRDRTAAYDAAIADLLDAGLAFHCTCSRQDLQSRSGAHAPCCPQCAEAPSSAAAIRVHARGTRYRFEDIFLGEVDLAEPPGQDDFVVRRRDGLYAYQLAVVVDDAFQRITHVVRGRDLLDSTPHQIRLRELLGLPAVRSGHVPLLLNAQGQKLSKQNLAPALDDRNAAANLLLCLRALGQQLPPAGLHGACPDILGWATDHWQRERLPAHDLAV